MKLYYSPGSCAMADHIALEWIGEPYEAVRVSREARGQPEFQRINPLGAVPAFEDDGWVLTQNAAILNYLADKHPGAGLGGDGTPKGRAEVNRWLALVNADIHPTFRPLFGVTDYLGEEGAEKTKNAARKRLRTLFETVDRQLAGKDWLVGSRSIADPYLFVVMRWAKANDVDLSGLDNLERFFQHMLADRDVQKVMKDEGLS
jgi:glutathione S-transferase